MAESRPDHGRHPGGAALQAFALLGGLVTGSGILAGILLGVGGALVLDR